MPTVYSVLWVPELDRGSQSATEIKLTQVFRVIYDPEDLGNGAHALFATDGTHTVPAFGEGILVPVTEGTDYGTGVDMVLFVNDKQSQRGSDPTYFDVYVTSSSLGTPAKQTGKWNIDISVDGVAQQDPVSYYADNTPIQNSSNQPYDPGLTKTTFIEKITVSYMTDSVDGDALAALRGNINTDEITMTIKGNTCHRALQNQPLMGASKPATELAFIYGICPGRRNFQ